MIEMCEFYDPTLQNKCWKGLKGGSKCMTQSNCPEYEPSRTSEFNKRIMDEALAYGYGIEPDVAIGGSHG